MLELNMFYVGYWDEASNEDYYYGTIKEVNNFIENIKNDESIVLKNKEPQKL